VGTARAGEDVLDEKFEIDPDTEKVLVDSKWMSKAEMAAKLAERLASMDYHIGKLSAAMEYLDTNLKSFETFSVRLAPEVADQLRQAAGRQSVHVAALIREAVVSYLVGLSLNSLRFKQD
jgi:hypothetical protein